jgi:cytoskeleton protein RodZ
MTTALTMDEDNPSEIEKPKIQLAELRQQKGYSIEYVANKLHLRVRIIELLENCDFNSLPEPVFVRGYLRAYSKLLGVSPDPFLAVFNHHYDFDRKPERALWQSKRETHKAENWIRWFTLVFAVGVMIAVGVWWQTNRDNHSEFSKKENSGEVSLAQSDREENLADLSTIQSLLLPDPHMSMMEKKDG